MRRKLRLALLVVAASLAVGLAAPQAAFAWTLTIGTQGPINGDVTGASGGAPGAFSCHWEAFTLTQSGVCAASGIPNANLVIVTATPEGIGTKAVWANCTTVVGNDCYVENQSTDRTVTVTFTNGFTLTVSTLGTGTGTVTSAPPGIACPTDCSEGYNAGQAVVLTATPGSTFFFQGWGGACAGAIGPTCTVTINSDLSVTASFGPTPSAGNLTVTLDGHGAVTSDPPGISCGQVCTGSFSGTVVLTEIPLRGWKFVRWEGCTSVQGNDCTVVVTGAKSVTAVFRDVAVLASVRDVSASAGPHGGRHVFVQLSLAEPAHVHVRVLRSGAVLAGKTTSKQPGLRTITLRISAGAAGGRARVSIVVTDDAGNTRTFTRTVRIPG